MYDNYGVVQADCLSLQDNSRVVLCYVPTVTSSTYSGLCSSGGSEPTSARCSKQSQILSAAGMCGASYLLSCQHLNSIALALNNDICDSMVSGLINVCVGQAFIGFFYFFVLVVGMMGMNRFNQDNYAGNVAQVHPEKTSDQKTDVEPLPPMVTQGNPAAQGGYSAEQAMAATKIQSIQRQKVARKKVQEKRRQKVDLFSM